MKPAVPAVAGAGGGAALMSFGLTRGEQGKVVGSQHDLGVAAGAAGVSACEVSHLPRDASGQLLWSEDPHAGDESFSGIAPACYSCHDGTVTDSSIHVFDVALAQHPVEPGEAGEDCDMCHDPHLADYGNFLLFPAGANLCRTCHAGGGSEGHPVNIDAVAVWDEGGSRPGTLLKCLSCHAAHGAASETLLSITADGPGSTSLCANCHRW